MIGVRVNVIQAFFDKDAILKAADKGTIRALAKAGAFVMRGARKRIKKAGRKNATSRPGESPRGHTDALRNNIFFALDMQKRRVLIGPAKLGGKIGSAPSALELGGRSQRRRNHRNGAKTIVNVVIEKRSYMGPALRADAPKFPQFFVNQVK